MIVAELSTSLILLAILACPIGMGLMMWLMARGMRGGHGTGMDTGGGERSLHELKADQARLAEKIAALERAAEPSAVPSSSSIAEHDRPETSEARERDAEAGPGEQEPEPTSSPRVA